MARRRRTSLTRSWKRSSSNFPPRRRSPAPPPPAPVSAASSPRAPSSAATANSIRRHSWDWPPTKVASTPPRNPIPPPRLPVPSPTPQISPTPSSPSPTITMVDSPRGMPATSATVASSSSAAPYGKARQSSNLAVCDPLARRYVLLPPIPEEMTVQQERLVEFEPVLAPIGEDEDETSFKVICTAHYKGKLATFVFSSVTGQWYIAASPSWSSLGTGEPSWECLSHFNYSHGCFYWTAPWSDKSKLLVLDTRIMEFYTVDVLTGYHLQLINQPHQSVCMSTIVDGTKGALEMFTLVGDYSPNLFHLYHTTQQNNGESSSKWQLKNVILLPLRCFYFRVGATEGFLFLRGVREAQWDDNLHGVLPEDNDVNFFSVEVETFELKKVCRATYYDFPNRVHSYFGFPPSLSKPSL